MANKAGHRPLDICAEFGDAQSLKLFLEHKAELHPSVLKKVVDQTRKQSLIKEKVDLLKEVYDAVLEHAKKMQKIFK